MINCHGQSYLIPRRKQPRNSPSPSPVVIFNQIERNQLTKKKYWRLFDIQIGPSVKSGRVQFRRLHRRFFQPKIKGHPKGGTTLLSSVPHKKIFGDLLSGRPLSSRPRIFSQTMASSPLSLSLSLLVAESCFGPALTPERDPRRNTAVAVSHDSECGKRTNVTTHRADVGEALQRWDFAVSMNLLQQVFFFSVSGTVCRC